MNHINLSDGELAALAARIQRNYDYDDLSGKLVNAKTGKMVKGVTRNKKNKYIYFGFKYLGMVRFINYHAAVWAWHNGCVVIYKSYHTKILKLPRSRLGLA